MFISTFALAVILISMSGIAYAMTFEGQTSNDSNTVDSQYIVLTLGDNTAADYSGKFSLNKIRYNTETRSAVTTWIPQYDTDTDDDSENDAIKTGSVILNVTTTDSFPYVIKMSKTGTMDTENFAVGVKIGSASETFMDFGSTQFDITGSLTGDKTITVSLYYRPDNVTTAPSRVMDDVTINLIAYAED